MHPEPIRQGHIDGSGDAGDGYEKDVIDIARLEAGAFQRLARCLLGHLRCDPQPRIVTLGERVERVVLGHRQREVAALDSQRALQAIEARDVAVTLHPQLAQRASMVLLRDVIFGQGRPDPADVRCVLHLTILTFATLRAPTL